MHNRVDNFLSKCNIFYEHQYGFCSKYSTEHAIIEFVSELLTSFDNGHVMLATFLDLSKAFDTVDHSILLKKLSHYGIRGNALNWFSSYLKGRKQYVYYTGIKLNTKDIDCGVPQGSVLGHLLFIIYTNDMPTNLTRSKSILFGDDTTLYASSDSTLDLIKIMNKELQILADWFKANKLSLNSTKTNYIIFDRKHTPSLQPVLTDGKIIDRVSSTKFLGIYYIDECLQWKDHIDHCKNKIRSGIYALNISKSLLTSNILRTLYFSLIHPNLIYGNILLGSLCKKYLNYIEVLQKKAIRIVAV